MMKILKKLFVARVASQIFYLMSEKKNDVFILLTNVNTTKIYAIDAVEHDALILLC